MTEDEDDDDYEDDDVQPMGVPQFFRAIPPWERFMQALRNNEIPGAPSAHVFVGCKPVGSDDGAVSIEVDTPTMYETLLGLSATIDKAYTILAGRPVHVQLIRSPNAMRGSTPQNIHPDDYPELKPCIDILGARIQSLQRLL